jgi:hypothetical protein
MKTLDFEINKINYPFSFLNCFLWLSILWLCFSFALLFPFIRDLIIRLGEAIVHRPLTHPIWHEKFLSVSIVGFISYFVFFLDIIFSQRTAKKITIVFLTVISVFFVFLIMYRANWSFGDDHEYITSTAINKMYQVWTSGGRFFPLGHIHYDLPLFIFRCLGINTGLPVEAHFAMIAVFCVVSVLCLYVLLKKIGPFPHDTYPFLGLFFASGFFLLGSAFSFIFLNLIYSEAQGIMFFSIFMLTYYKALKTDKIRYYIISFIVAAYNTYCKEPIFGVFLVVTLTNLLFRWKEASKREKIFYFALIANGALFIILYYFLSFKNATSLYNEGIETVGRFQLFLSVLRRNPIFGVMLIFSLIRLFMIILKKDKEHLYYDGLLFAGMSYVLAYIILRLGYSYYFMPSIILFLPSIVYWIKYAYNKKSTFAVFLFFCFMPICANNVGQTAVDVKNIWLHRQMFTPYITDLLSDYNSGNKFIWYESDNRITENTFYMSVRSWRKSILNAFLNYQNKSEGKEFFTVIKPKEHIDMEQNILFFYPMDNDQYQPMKDDIVNTLQNSNFIIYEDYGILIYKRR